MFLRHLNKTGLGLTFGCSRIIHPKQRTANTNAYFHNSQVKSRNLGSERGMPSVYYYQNPFEWLKIKLQLLKLKKWDNEFNEKEFTRGSTEAVCVVTRIVRDNKLNDLEGLLTPFALSKLRRDILVLWNDDIIRNIGMKQSDIKLAVPTKIHIQTAQRSHKKLCNIDMWYMAMKWKDLDNLLIVDLVTRFKGDFTNLHSNQGWTISFFELRKYHVQTYNNENF